MSKFYVLDDEGEVKTATLEEWGEFMKHADKRQTALTHITPEIRVSTVFLGMDHGWGSGEPVLWETMIFGGDRDQEQFRYTSEADALDSHAKIVEELKETP